MTPHRFIAGIITERGIFRPPYTESLKRAFEQRRRVARLEAAWRRRASTHFVLCASSASKPPATKPPPRSSKRPATRRRPWAIRSNVVASQVPIHREWGGVVPELASRQHIRDICGVVERALDEARHDLERSRRHRGHAGAGPGRVAARRRVVREGRGGRRRPAARRRPSSRRPHRVARAAERRAAAAAVVLVVSGGHTSLYLVERPGRYQLLSRTRDDAAGEAYDKVAKLLGLGLSRAGR